MKYGSLFLLTITLLISNGLHAQSNVYPPSGNVGIGTSNPDKQLVVRGDVRLARPSSGGYNYIDIYSNALGAYIIADDPTVHQKSFFIGVAPTSFGGWDRHIYFQAGSTTDGKLINRMVIRGSGNVGIGTTNPLSKLDVNGTVRAKEVKLEATNWPDYVFEDGYNLMPLEEVKIHIQQKGHLPRLKPAKEYQAEGVNILELNQRLLEKIEELTLYTIRQQELIEEERAKSRKQCQLIENQQCQLERIKERMERMESAPKGTER